MATAPLQLDFQSGAHLQRGIDALCGRYGYQPTIADPANPGASIPNTQTKAQFAKQVVANWLRDETKAWEDYTAAQTAKAAVSTIGVA